MNNNSYQNISLGIYSLCFLSPSHEFSANMNSLFDNSAPVDFVNLGCPIDMNYHWESLAFFHGYNVHHSFLLNCCISNSEMVFS